jgi:hypothetical protein
MQQKEDAMTMRVKILGLLAVALLAGSMAANAGFALVVTRETATDSTGTFAITTDGNFNFNSPALNTVGSLFPDGYAYKQLIGMRVPTNGGSQGFFGTRAIGTPDSPGVDIIWIAADQTFASRSGMYNNNAAPWPGSSRRYVYFLISNLAATGSSTGIFSGSFCFSAAGNRCFSTASVPAPGALVLMAVSLVGVGFARRRRIRQQT